MPSFAVANLPAPAGSLQRSRLYAPDGSTVISEALTESSAGLFGGSVDLSPVPPDSLLPYEYEVRQVSAQDDASLDASTIVTLSRGTYGYLALGDWYDSAAYLKTLLLIGVPANASLSADLAAANAALGQFPLANGLRGAVPWDYLANVAIAAMPIGTLLTIIGGNGAYNLTQDGGVGASGAAITLNGVALTTDALRVLDANNAAVANAAVQLFLASDTTYTAYVGTTITGVDGRWVGPIKANSGSYTLLVSAQGEQARAVTGISIP